MARLRTEAWSRAGAAAPAALLEAHRALEAALVDELPAALERVGERTRAVAWFRAERFVAEEADAGRAFAALAASVRQHGPALSAYLDVQEYVTRVRRLTPRAGGVELGPPTQRFTYRLGRREAILRLGLASAPFLMFLDDETGLDGLVFRLPGGALQLFLEVPELFGHGDVDGALDVPCLVLGEDGRTLDERTLRLVSVRYTDPAGLVAAAHTHGAVLFRNPHTTLLAIAVADGEGAVLCEYLYADAHVERGAMEGFAPADPLEPARSWKDVLACPACRADLPNPDVAPLACPGCGRSFELAPTGAPRLLLPEHEPRDVATDEEWIPNTPPKVLHYFLCRYPNGLVLDSGAGSDPLRAPNLVNLEIFPFASTTVVASGERLPFRDGAFDAAMSSAVLEHVPDPPAYCREFGRVIRPGGEGRLDSAFLQPYHACPDHYYGTTLSGLRLASGDLDEVAAGVSDSQSPFIALQTWLHAYASTLPEEHRARFFGATVSELCNLPPGRGPSFARVPPARASALAAGVYRHVKRPPA